MLDPSHAVRRSVGLPGRVVAAALAGVIGYPDPGVTDGLVRSGRGCLLVDIEPPLSNQDASLVARDHTCNHSRPPPQTEATGMSRSCSLLKHALPDRLSKKEGFDPGCW